MGIREYFKQHPESEDLKIQNFNIKTEQKPDELFIDPEKEITEEDWQEILKFLEDFQKDIKKNIERKEWRIRSLLEFLANLKILFPEKAKQLDLDDNIFYYIKKNTQIRHMGYIKIINPQKFSQFGVKQTEIEKVEYEINSYDNGTELIIYDPIAYKIMYPRQKFSNDIINRLHKFFLEDKGNLYANPLFLTALKLYFPEEFAKIKLDQTTWQIFRKNIDRLDKKNDWDAIIRQLIQYKIIAAQEIKITDQGVEFIMSQKSLKVEKSKRPERKKF